MFNRRSLIAATGAAVLAGPAHAQNFPRKAIQMIVAFPAGGSTDIIARLVGTHAVDGRSTVCQFSEAAVLTRVTSLPISVLFTFSSRQDPSPSL